MSGIISLVLAAGKGTRMKSVLPKVLHTVGGQPMVQHVLDAAVSAGATRNIVVVGFGADAVAEKLGAQAELVVQAEQLGTGHAVLQAKELLAQFTGTVLVLCGDTPLLEGTELNRLIQAHKEKGAVATVLTAHMPDPAGYGRVIRNEQGQVIKIVEQKDATAAELQVSEVNSGIYCFECQPLFAALSNITCANAQGEYYLTDVIGILVSQAAVVWAVPVEDFRHTLGINSRVQLAEAESILRRRKLVELMEVGVTIMDPASTFVDKSVTVGADTTIYPFTWLEGSTTIGSNCSIGPNTRIANTNVGDGSTLHFLYAHECTIGKEVTVGPYVHLRPQTVLADGVKIGNFVEVKNSNIGETSKIPHLSYIGDTDMGSGVNIGSGTITVNYDGKNKHRTTIEDNAFIGCNTNLVAPVTVGQNSYIAAGSTITKNVPPDALGVARARQSNLEGWRKSPKKD